MIALKNKKQFLQLRLDYSIKKDYYKYFPSPKLLFEMQELRKKLQSLRT